MSSSRKPLATAKTVGIWIGMIAAVLVSLGVVGVGLETVYAHLYDGRIFPGVRILNVRLDGLTQVEAQTLLEKNIDTALEHGLRFRFSGQDVTLQASTASVEADASRELIHYNLDQALNQAMDIGRNDGWRVDLFEQVGARVGTLTIPSDIRIDDQAVIDGLRQSLKDKIQPTKDASFQVVLSKDSAPLIHIEPEQQGVVFNTSSTLATLHAQAAVLDFRPIELHEEHMPVSFRSSDLEPLTQDVMELIQRPRIVLTYEDKSYVIATSTLIEWITVTGDRAHPRVDFDPQKVAQSLRTLMPNIEQTVKNGSLVIKDGKIESFVPGTQGRRIDVEGTLAAIQKDWPKQTTFPLKVEITSGALLGEDPERLGLKEIIGIGRSNFSGSPSNRRKNIQHGVDKVNGSILAPGEEFSLLKTLGQIDGTTGWLPELVIKGDKTTPEFGGGLCQIGTTTFRAALQSGLKITQRQNHSYRVRYYEPAGTDATIYDPAPDFRFVNDTQHHILINAFIQGDEVIFEVWGTKDGRAVDVGKSRIYNISVPPPTKLIETLDLKPGEKKCTEKAHNGADAEFAYHVGYADGTKHDEVFTSHYRAWQAVCLIGVEKLSTSPEPTAPEVPLSPDAAPPVVTP